MKNQYSMQLELITPCFCAGADQGKAEIRVPSLRGELRWWFRVLGGDAVLEQEIFGGVHGERAKSSNLVIRISNCIPAKQEWKPPSMKPQTALSYIWYFANASGKARGSTYGPRFLPAGFLSPGYRFQIDFSLRRPLPIDQDTLLQLSLRAFAYCGSLGYRATRGAGAWEVIQLDGIEPIAAVKEYRHLFGKQPFEVGIACKNHVPAASKRWEDCLGLLESCLKGGLRRNFSAGQRGNRTSPLGSSGPRQRSAVHLRPIIFHDEFYALLFYAPRTLGPQSLPPSGFTLRGLGFQHPWNALPVSPYTISTDL